MANILKALAVMIIFTASCRGADFLKESLVGHYEFECNTEDSGPLAQTLTEYGDPECTDEGQLLRGYKFDGDDAVLFPTNNSSPYYSDLGFTWSLWINPDSLPTSQQNEIGMSLISFADSQNGNDVYLGFGSPYTPARELTFLVDGAGGAGGSAFLLDGICRHYPEGGFEDSTWYHIAGVRDYENKTVSLYLNGLLVSTKTFEVQEPLAANNPGAIAGYTEGGDPTDNFRGTVDEVRFYQKPLTAEEVLKLYSLKPDQLRSDTDTLDFLDIWCEDDKTLTLEVFNIGPSNFDITEIQLKEGTAFSFTDPSPLTLTYPEADTLAIDITFTPTNSRGYSDTIFFYNNLGFPPLAIPLIGNRAAFAVDTVDIGNNLICAEDFELIFPKEFNGITQGRIVQVENILSSYPDITTDLAIGDELNIGSNDEITFTFSPTEAISLNDSIIIDFSNCYLKKKIMLKGRFIDDTILYNPLVDFGIRSSGELLDTTIYVVYPALAEEFSENIEIIDYKWLVDQGIYRLEDQTGNNDMFSVSGDTVRFGISAIPPPDLVQDTLQITFKTPCGNRSIPIAISTNGQFVAKATLTPEELYFSNLGEQQEVKIVFSEVTDIIASGITDISFDLVWNGSIMTAPDEVNLDIDGPYTVRSGFTIRASEILNESVVLFLAQGTLGNTLVDSMRIENISAQGGYYSFASSAASIQIDKDCINAEDFLLFKKESLLELSIAPNPVTGATLTGTLVTPTETNEIKYTIIDISGNILQTGNTILDGQKFEIISIRNISKGSYILQIEIETNAGKMSSSINFKVTE